MWVNWKDIESHLSIYLFVTTQLFILAFLSAKALSSWAKFPGYYNQNYARIEAKFADFFSQLMKIHIVADLLLLVAYLKKMWIFHLALG